MTDTLGFHPVSDPVPTIDEYIAQECRCPQPDDQYLLQIEEGSAFITHAACGNPPPGDWGDYQLELMLDSIPVRLQSTPNCDGSEWHGEHRCDCGSSLVITVDGLETDDDLDRVAGV